MVNGKLREELIGRMEVLDKVKGLLLLPNTEFATLQQVADFYKVSTANVEMVIKRNLDELTSDGFGLNSRKEVINFLNQHDVSLENVKGKTIVTLDDGNEIVVPNRGLRLFPRRAILRVGMFLRDSEVAKEVRDQLLNIEEKTYVEIKVADINEEQELALAIGMAMANGVLVALGEANAKMMAFKNRHITILERVSSHPHRIVEQKPMVTFAEKISYKLASPK